MALLPGATSGDPRGEERVPRITHQPIGNPR